MTVDEKTRAFDFLKLGMRAQRIRSEKNISIESLAGMAGVNKNTVVRFEKGLPTRMDTIYKICNVLKVSPFHLVEGKLVNGKDYAIQKHRVRETGNDRSGHIPRQNRVRKEIVHGMTVGDLNYHLPEGQLSAKVLEIREKCEPCSHRGEELLFCLTGSVGVEISNITATLNKGDAIFFWGAEPHCYFNAHEKKAVSVALSVVNGDVDDTE